MDRLRSLPRASQWLVIAIAVAVAVLGVVSFSRALSSFQSLGFVAERAGEGWRVRELTAAGTGLEVDDQILEVGGQSADRAGQLLRAEAETRILIMRGEVPLPVVYHRPPLALDLNYLIQAVIGVFYLLIGVYTALRVERPGSRLFFFWCLASATFYLLTPSGHGDVVGRTLYYAEEIARALLPPVTLHLFLNFPHPLGRRPLAFRGLRLIPFLYLPAMALLAGITGLIVLTGSAVSLDFTRGSLAFTDRAQLIHLVAFVVASVAVLVYRIGREQGTEEKRQLRWVAIGLSVGYLPFVAFYLVPYVLGLSLPSLLGAAAVLPLALVPLTFAWAILRYKLWDIAIVLREATSTVITVILAGAVFSVAHLAVNRGLPERLSMVRDFLTFGSGLAIAGLLVPARRRVSSSLERFQYGRAVTKRRALERLGRELLQERDLVRLSTELLEDLADAIDLERANLYLFDPSGTLLPADPLPGDPERIGLVELPAGLWTRETWPLNGAVLPGEQPGPAERLFVAGYRYVFPVAVRDMPLGLLVTGFKRDSEPLSSDDTRLVRQLLSGAALAIENAKLMTELHSQLAEIVRLQHFSQGIIESSPAGIAVVDAEQRILSANGAFGQMFDRPNESLLGEVLSVLLPVGALPHVGEPLREITFVDAAGRERHFQLSSADFQAPGEPGENRETRQVLVVHDVSERVAMERAMREKDRLAALGLLAAGVAHEVNTPITGISSYAQLLLADTREDDPRYEILKKVEKQTFRAARIVNSLLEFARNRTDERRPVDLAPLLRETLDLLDERRSRRGCRLELDLPETSLPVFGSDGELQQIFTNLVLNALDAMPEGGHLKVAARRDACHIEVAVSDTGAGIAAERLARIFEPFFSTKLDQGGTGLGLTITSDLVRRHAGEIRVESAAGQGSTFFVRLPIHGELPALTAASTRLESLLEAPPPIS